MDATHGQGWGGLPVRGATALAAFAALLLAASLAGGEAAPAGALRIRVGEQRSLSRDEPITRVAIGDPEIADVRAVSDHELLLQGLAPGSTSLILWTERGTEERPVLVEPTTRAADAAVAGAGEENLHVTTSGGQLRLAGEVTSLQGYSQAVRAIEAQTGSRPLEGAVLGFDSQVQIDVKFVEVSRQSLRQAGINLVRNNADHVFAISPPGAISGIEAFVLESTSGFLPIANAFQLIAGEAENGTAALLSALESHGFAHTLAEPTLVVSSGQTASFLAGGEFPVPVSQASGGTSAITIEYRPFGVRVQLTPTVLGADHIVLKVAPEVSELDFSAGVEAGGVSVPALTTRRADTTVELGNGETFVIGGLVSRDMAAAVDKIPYLGDIPVLGAFFRSVRFDREDKELLMIVSPTLVRAFAKGAETPELPGAERETYDPSLLHLLTREDGEFRARRTGFTE